VPETWWFCFFYSITFGGFLALVSYLAIYFNTAYGIDAVRVSYLVAVASLLGSVLRPVGGFVADRVSGVVLGPIVLTVFALCALVVATQPPLALCALFVFVMTGALGMGNGAIFQVVPQRFPAQIGIVTGIVGAAGGLGGFYLPNLLALTRTATGTFASGFIIFAAIAVVGAVLLALVGRSWSTSFLGRERTAFAFSLEEG
jgi:NNP family nitrate/nitrite transporter-like MFS transporter